MIQGQKRTSEEAFGSTDKENIAPDTDRANFLKGRYGYVVEMAITQPDDHHLHFKVNEKAVHQGLCYFNADSQTYFMRSRQAQNREVPKELINMELERPVDSPYTEWNFLLQVWVNLFDFKCQNCSFYVQSEYQSSHYRFYRNIQLKHPKEMVAM